MALPPWTIEVLRRGLSDVARKASEPETLEKLKSQATEILQDLPQTAARGIDAMMRGAEAGKKSVERWSRKHTALAIPMLNASGVLISENGSGVPLAEEVTEVGREMISGDTVSGPEMKQRLSSRLQRLLPSGDHAIAITSNFHAALTAFSLLVQRRQLVVHRANAVRLPAGRPLPDAFGTLLPVIQEVGSVDGIRKGDFDALESFCAIIADGGQHPAELLDLTGHDAMQAVVLPVATLEATTHQSIPSAESMLGAGADFVIMAGDGVAGGPPSGILVGNAEPIAWIQQSAAWPALAADEATVAMITVALQTARSNSDRIPIRALMSTSEENLRDRAERLATRLSGSESVANCQITAEDARLLTEGRWRFPSRQVRLRHASMPADVWAGQLSEELPAVLANVDGDDLCIDLRWIAAADDGKLAETLGGTES